MRVAEARACQECGERITKSVVTDSYFYNDQEGTAVIWASPEGFMHIHGAGLVKGGTDMLTVRAAVRRWWRIKRLRARWVGLRVKGAGR